MLLTTELSRIFLLEDKGTTITLADPDPQMSTEAVLNFYSNSYPILTTAKLSGPEFIDDHVQYKFNSVMGTKG